MNRKQIRWVVVAGALAVGACLSVDARAQCCGNWWGGGTTTAYYAPSYATYDTGWYPGYWWNRVTARLWGSPTTYVAAYPTTYAGYSGCTTCGTSGWWPTSSGCSTCANYAPSSCCGSCASPCSSCSSYSVGNAPTNCSSCSSGYVTSYAPSCGCTTCGSTCASNCGCNGCASGSSVTQSTYLQPSTGCNCGSHGVQPTQYTGPAAGSQSQPQPTPAVTNGAEPKPSYDVNRVPSDVNPPPSGVQPVPGTDSDETKKSDSGASFEPPALFNPKDRTASRASLAPVHTAVYKQAAAYRPSSADTRVSKAPQPPRQDVIGWTSGAN